MKRIIIFAIFLASCISYSKAVIPSGDIPVKSLAVSDEVAEIIRDIISVIGLKPNFEVKAANVPNAAAVTYAGKRYIAYNPQFLRQLTVATGNKWAAVSVLAHEIGHHLNGHTLKSTGSLPALEREADEFSGFVLKKMGATLVQAQSAMKLVAGYRPSHTHPAKQDRLMAIQNGWNSAGGSVAQPGKYNQAGEIVKLEKTIPVSQSQKNAKLEDRFVLARVDFKSDRQSDYYVTTRYNFVKVTGSKLSVLGKMVPTNNRHFPYKLQGNFKQPLYIDRSGNILTPDRKLEGFLRI